MTHEAVLMDDAFVVVWERPELADVQSVVNAVARARKERGRPLLYVAYIPDAAATPEPPVRDAMSRSMKLLLEYCESIVFVLEGSGFRMSIGRAALAGIMLASGNRGRVHIAGTIEEAASKLPRNVVQHLCSTRIRVAAE